MWGSGRHAASQDDREVVYDDSQPHDDGEGAARHHGRGTAALPRRRTTRLPRPTDDGLPEALRAIARDLCVVTDREAGDADVREREGIVDASRGASVGSPGDSSPEAGAPAAGSAVPATRPTPDTLDAMIDPNPSSLDMQLASQLPSLAKAEWTPGEPAPERPRRGISTAALTGRTPDVCSSLGTVASAAAHAPPDRPAPRFLPITRRLESQLEAEAATAPSPGGPGPASAPSPGEPLYVGLADLIRREDAELGQRAGSPAGGRGGGAGSLSARLAAALEGAGRIGIGAAGGGGESLEGSLRGHGGASVTPRPRPVPGHLDNRIPATSSGHPGLCLRVLSVGERPGHGLASCCCEVERGRGGEADADVLGWATGDAEPDGSGGGSAKRPRLPGVGRGGPPPSPALLLVIPAAEAPSAGLAAGSRLCLRGPWRAYGRAVAEGGSGRLVIAAGAEEVEG